MDGWARLAPGETWATASEDIAPVEGPLRPGSSLPHRLLLFFFVRGVLRGEGGLDSLGVLQRLLRGDPRSRALAGFERALVYWLPFDPAVVDREVVAFIGALLQLCGAARLAVTQSCWC